MNRPSRTPILFSLLLPALLAAVLASPTGAAGFLTGPSAGDPLDIAQSYIHSHREALGLTEGDLAEWTVSDRYVTRHNGVTHLYLVQRLGGIEVWNGQINVNVTRDGRIVNLGNRFVSNLSAAINASAPAISAEQAVRRAAEDLQLTPSATLVAVQTIGGPAQAVVFAASGLSLDDIPVALKYLPVRPGVARLVWDLRLRPDDQHAWQMQVDAVTGEVRQKLDLVRSDTYKVYAHPAESPNHVEGLPLPPADGRTLVDQTAADLMASPFGWHDVNGLAGGDTTNTTGNNVFAQTDTDANDVFTPGIDVQPSSPTREFIYPVDLTQGPETYRDALVTNLFYWNNIAHDIHYLYGFDEASGNFQINNYLRGGVGQDAVQADAQDGSGTNNANMLTLPEGIPPRMQMFTFISAQRNEVVVNSPSGLGPYPASAAAFGPPFDTTGVTGDLVLADDGTGTTSDGCEAVQNDVSGKIALVDRGSCNFIVKVQNAQAAGAIAVLVANNQAGAPVTMGGDEDPLNPVTIPSAMVRQEHGAELKSHLPGVNVTARQRLNQVDRDSDFDNGVILHEYGHGVSNRLTGGPANTFCLLLEDQSGSMGEGWSDFWALALTAREGKNGTEPRGIGTYVSFQDPPGFGVGIRPYPYSTDLSVDPQTYGDLTTGTLSVPHGVGSVWATTLWDLYWALVNGVPELGLAGHGYRQNLYGLTPPLAGNQLALQLVMDGLKLQPCEPSFLEARDAILAADLVDNGGANRCHIWWAFARRGMGTNAQDGGGGLNVTPGFAMPVECAGPNCTSAPSFAGASGVTSATAGACKLTVHWSPASDNCDSGSITYSVYRSTDPQFIPSADNLVASGLAGTSYEDSAVDSGVRYYYVVRATDGRGNSDSNLVRRSEVPVGTLTPGDSFHDDAGDTTPVHFQDGIEPNNTWSVRSAGGVGGSAVYASTPAGNYADSRCITLESETIYLGAEPTLSFSTKYDFEAIFDGGIVEIATAEGGFSDWQKVTSIAYPGLMAGALVDTACPNPGLRDGEPAFTGTTAGEFLSVSGSLAEYAGKAVKIRFVLGSDEATNDLGWLVDEIRIDHVQRPGPCTRTGTCQGSRSIDDSDPAVESKGGWHRIDDANASNGGYLRRMGNKNGGSTPAVRVVFTGESVAYHYAKSDAGGSADVYVDGALRETLSYQAAGAVSFGHTRTYSGLGAGQHEIRIEHRSGAVYVDGFTFGCDEAADASAAQYRSETSASTASSSEGAVIERAVEVEPGDEEVSVVIEGSAVPLTVHWLDPLGNVVATGGALVGGLAASGLDAAVSAPGTYKVRVLNTPGAFQTVRVSTARTVRLE